MSANWSQLVRFVVAGLCVISLSRGATVRGDDPPANPPAQKKEEPQPRDAKSAPGKKLLKLTADEETQALGFARSQHPELADLLEGLKKNDPKEYAKALLDLHRAQVRIGRLADKNPERFSLELSLWKTESRIRLLAAQLAMEGDETSEAGLKALLAERRELKVQLAQLDRTKALKNVADLDRQLETLQANPAEQDEKELNKLKQSVAKQQKVVVKSKKKKAKDAAAPEGTPSPEPKAKKASKKEASKPGIKTDASKID